MIVLAATNYPWQLDEALEDVLKTSLYELFLKSFLKISHYRFRCKKTALQINLKGVKLEQNVDLEELSRKLKVTVEQTNVLFFSF